MKRSISKSDSDDEALCQAYIQCTKVSYPGCICHRDWNQFTKIMKARYKDRDEPPIMELRRRAYRLWIQQGRPKLQVLHRSPKIDERKNESSPEKNYDTLSDQSTSSTNSNNDAVIQQNISQSSTAKKKKVKRNNCRLSLSQNTTTSKGTTSKSVASLTKGEVQLAEIIEFTLYRQNIRQVNHTIIDHVKENGPKWKPELKKILENRMNSTKKTVREWIYSLLREDKKGLKNAFDSKRKKIKAILEKGKPCIEYDLYLTATEQSNFTPDIPIEVLKRNPLHKVGDKVKASFNNDGWFDGEVHRFRKKEGEHYYHIVFEDGDNGEIHELHVQSHKEYDLQRKFQENELGPDIGICNWCSSNTGGIYEKYGGWWKCNTTDNIYLTLSDLIREQDDAVVQKKTIHTREEDLQCPDDWDFDVKPPVRIEKSLPKEKQKNSPLVDTSFEESSDVSDQAEQFPFSSSNETKSSLSNNSETSDRETSDRETRETSDRETGPGILEDDFFRHLSAPFPDDRHSLASSSANGSEINKRNQDELVEMNNHINL